MKSDANNVIASNAELELQAARLKEINQILTDSEQRLRLAIAAGGVGLWVWNSSDVTNAGDWSPRLKEIMGLPLDAVVTHDMFLKCVHPEDRERVDQCVMQALGGVSGGEYSAEYRTISPADGSKHWVTAKGQAFFNPEGQAIRFIGTVIDITDRKQAEQSLNRLNSELEERISQRVAELARTNLALENEIAERKRVEDELRRSKAYLEHALELSHTGSVGFRVSERQLFWSPETARMYGYDPAIPPTREMVLARVHPDDRPLLEEAFVRIAKGGATFDFEHRLLMPDGSIKYLHTRAHTVTDELGNEECLGALTDITEQVKAKATVEAAFEDRKRVEDDLRRSKAYLEHAQKLSHTGSVGFRVSDGQVFWSEETARIYDYDPAIPPTMEMVLARVHPDDLAHLKEVFRQAAAGGASFDFEHRLLMPDGSIKYIANFSHSVKDEAGHEEVMGAVTDITERKQAAEALRASEHLARGQLEALTTTLSALARETEPDKILEHVVCMIVRRLDAHSIGVWEINEDSGRVELLGHSEGERLRLTKKEEREALAPVMSSQREHPVWSEFFRSGNYCVQSTIEADGSKVRILDDSDTPWHDWLGDVVDDPNLPIHLKRLAAQGVSAALSVPMFVAGKVTGFLSIRLRQWRDFRREEIELTRALAHQAMLAIQLTRLSAQSRQAAVMEERNRMARDIHDTLAQGFTGVIVQLEAAEDASSQGLTEEARAHLSRAGEMARYGLKEARRSVQALRPQVLEDNDLCTAMHELFRKTTAGTILEPEFSVRGMPGRFPSQWEENLLRIAQEVLTNALRHAQAKHFKARLHFEARQLSLKLSDDGCGFDPALHHDGFGLMGMRERVEQMGGQISMQSEKGEGTIVSLVLPFPDDDQSADS